MVRSMPHGTSTSIPIYLIISEGSYFPEGNGKSHLEASFTLRCFQRLSRPYIATSGAPGGTTGTPAVCPFPVPLVLRTGPLKFPTPATDRDRTVSRRSEPSSRTALMGEQPNPWDRLQPQDAMSRHRGAKPPRRCGLLGR